MRKLKKIYPYEAKLKELAKKLRQNSTLSEILLWKQLRNKQMMGYDFDRQQPLLKYIVDFFCDELALVIEIDGESHNNPEVDVYDQQRQAEIEHLGIRFLRFSDLEVKRNMYTVLYVIQLWIEEFEKNQSS